MKKGYDPTKEKPPVKGKKMVKKGYLKGKPPTPPVDVKKGK